MNIYITNHVGQHVVSHGLCKQIYTQPMWEHYTTYNLIVFVCFFNKSYKHITLLPCFGPEY
jgi:hypothetical protein